MVTTNKQRRLGWSLYSWLARVQDLAGRAKGMRGGGGGRGEKNKTTFERPLWSFADFLAKLEVEERAECFDRCSRAYAEFC